MATDELEYQLNFIRASIQEIDDRLKSERDRGRIADYKLLLKVLQSGERLLSAGKSRHDLAGEIAQGKEELSSPTIDTAPPVTLIEERRAPGEVFPSPRYPHEVLPRPFPVRLTVSRQVPRRQYVEEQVQSAEFRLTKLDAEIPRLEREYSRLYELALRVLPGFKPDEISKKPTAELAQMGNRISTSATSREPIAPRVEELAAASPSQSAADKNATEPELAVEEPQQPPSIPTPAVALEPPLESDPTQRPHSETPAIAGAIPGPEQSDAGAPFPLSNRQIYEQYQDEYYTRTRNALGQKEILKETKCGDRTELARWLRQDPKYFNEDAEKIFRELFTIN